MQPKSKAADIQTQLEKLNETVLRIKTENKNPYIMMGSHINGFSLNSVLCGYPDLRLEKTPPTYGDQCLDVFVSSLPAGSVIDTDCYPPLSSDKDSPSDHRVLIARLKIVHRHEFDKP